MSSDKGDKKIQSNLEIELAINAGGIHLSCRGTIAQLSREMPAISDLVMLAKSKLSFEGTTIFDAASASQEGDSSIPVIKAENSTTANVDALFSTPWGKSPKSVEDVMKALDANAAADSNRKISVALLRLVKQQKLRRAKKNLKWHYHRIATG